MSSAVLSLQIESGHLIGWNIEGTSLPRDPWVWQRVLLSIHKNFDLGQLCFHQRIAKMIISLHLRQLHPGTPMLWQKLAQTWHWDAITCHLDTKDTLSGHLREENLNSQRESEWDQMDPWSFLELNGKTWEHTRVVSQIHVFPWRHSFIHWPQHTLD